MLSIIVAVAHDNVIGYEGKMPWHLPAELAYFKATTMGKPVIMGRKTFDSIGRTLPGRRNIVVTRNRAWQHVGVETAASLGDALSAVANNDAFVIGGATLYEAALPHADRVYLTQIDATLEGDTFFPVLDAAHWTLVSRVHRAHDGQNPHDLAFCIYEATQRPSDAATRGGHHLKGG
jgi:dihydrofolate reductase